MATIPQDQNQDVFVAHDGQTFYFPVGVEGMTVEMGARAVTTQALDQFWCDSLGPSIPMVTLTGHTGWHVIRDNRDGKQQFATLVEMHKHHMGKLASAPNSTNSLLFLHDPTSGMSFRCFATTLHITRDKTQPLLFNFSWSLTVVQSYTVEGATQPDGLTGTSYFVDSSDPIQSRQSRGNQAGQLQTNVATTLPGGATRYVVKNGDTLNKLVQLFYPTATTDSQRKKALGAVTKYPLNHIRDVTKIYIGEVIYFPNRI